MDGHACRTLKFKNSESLNSEKTLWILEARAPRVVQVVEASKLEGEAPKVLRGDLKEELTFEGPVLRWIKQCVVQ